MNKTEIIRILEETAGNLGKIIESSRPETSGSLNLKTVKGRPLFFCRTEEGKQKYVKMSDDGQIKRLSYNYYAKKLKAAAVKEKKQIDNCLDILSKDPEKSDVDKVTQRIPEAIKDNLSYSELTNEGYARRWQEGNKVVKKRRIHDKDDYHRFKTLRGDYVGSKSEVIIADRLTYYGVPYVYEITTAQDAFDEMRYPDFFILNKRTRKEYFWEHLGRMGDPQYAAKNQVKMEQFARQGILPGNNLIVSFECGERPLSTEYVDTIIKQLLV